MTIDEADELVPHLLRVHLCAAYPFEIEGLLEDRLVKSPIGTCGGPYALSLRFSMPTGGPWSFTVTAPAYQAAPLDPDWDDPEVALQQLIWRYLEGFGPASAADFAQFALQRQTEIGPALKGMADVLSRSKAGTAPSCSMCPAVLFRPRTPLPRRACYRCGTAPSLPTRTEAGSSPRGTAS